jgi:putative SOS response-associated peptidase YedK
MLLVLLEAFRYVWPLRAKSDKQKIAEALRVSVGFDEPHILCEHDIAPGSMQPVVSVTENGERKLELMRWGFKLPDRLLFNARSEGIESFKFWKDAFLEGRIIVPADAIFEWKQMPKGQKKSKDEFALSGQEPFGIAGVWKLWKNPKTNQWERTFPVVTGESNELVQPIHARMTTFLQPRDYEEYLAPAERPPVHLLRIVPADKMRARLVEITPILRV